MFGIAPGCFGLAVIVPAALMVPKPPGLSFVEAATLPTVFVTVFTALGLPGLQQQDKVRLPPPCCMEGLSWSLAKVTCRLHLAHTLIWGETHRLHDSNGVGKVEPFALQELVLV